jgi:hypothetical protein
VETKDSVLQLDETWLLAATKKLVVCTGEQVSSFQYRKGSLLEHMTDLGDLGEKTTNSGK